MGEVLDAYAAGFEAMGALARASHPALYDRGLHPTAVCGGVGAAVTAARLMRLDPGAARARPWPSRCWARPGCAPRSARTASRSRWGWPPAAGVRAARLAAAGARVPLEAAARGFAEAAGGAYAEPDPAEPRDRAQLDQGLALLPPDARVDRGRRARPRGGRRAGGGGRCTRCRSRRRRWARSPQDGLQAKFSIPYLIAYTLLHGDAHARELRGGGRRGGLGAREAIEVRTDRGLLESEAVLLDADGAELARVEAALGSPERPLDERALAREGGAGWPATGWRARSTTPSGPAAELLDAGRARA